MLIGIVFLVSGIGKSLAAYEFSQNMVQYGFTALRFFAPFVIAFEVFLGMLLFLNIKPKLTSLLAICFVVALSAIYLYGYFFVHIADCGCFGRFSFLNLSPFFTFLRNLVLISILLYIFLESNNLKKLPGISEIIIMACILCIVCFVTGYTFSDRQNEGTQYITKGKEVNVNVTNTILGEYFSFSKDSTYFVFAFSYTCPHCINSIENLKQYGQAGVADKILALSFIKDSMAVKEFNDILIPNFPIKNIESKQFFRLTNRFPVSYYVKNNMIKMEIRGTLPNGYWLRHQLNKLEN